MNESLKTETITDLIDLYCRAWNEPNAVHRRAILEAVFSEAATYTDPTVDALEIEALVWHIGTMLVRRPGAKIIRASSVNEHHGFAQFAFQVLQADGVLLREGIDFVDLTFEGKIRRIVGFFGSFTTQ